VELNPFATPQALDLPTPPAPEAGEFTFKSTTPLATAITVVMALLILAQVADIVNSVLAIGVMRRVETGAPYEHSELTAIDVRTGAAALAALLVQLAAVVLFCFFMPRANRNARAFGGGPLQFTPRWAAGVFFVPFWHLYKPYRAMKEIWQCSDPDPAVSPYEVNVPGLFNWWWGTFLVDGTIQQIVQRVFSDAKDPGTFIVKCYAVIVSSVFSMLAAALAAMVVRRVAQRQDERQRRAAAATPPLTAAAAL